MKEGDILLAQIKGRVIQLMMRNYRPPWWYWLEYGMNKN
tara:strand:+ start:1042 stop:1158 length:117 start_codon:yes stop_codon:yes gene_type:complete